MITDRRIFLRRDAAALLLRGYRVPAYQARCGLSHVYARRARTASVRIAREASPGSIARV